MIEQDAHLCTGLVACVLNIACSMAEAQATADCSARQHEQYTCV